MLLLVLSGRLRAVVTDLARFITLFSSVGAVLYSVLGSRSASCNSTGSTALSVLYNINSMSSISASCELRVKVGALPLFRFLILDFRDLRLALKIRRGVSAPGASTSCFCTGELSLKVISWEGFCSTISTF